MKRGILNFLMIGMLVLQLIPATPTSANSSSTSNKNNRPQVLLQTGPTASSTALSVTPTPTPTVDPTPTPSEIPDDNGNGVSPTTVTIRYVSTTGTDNSNDCIIASSPCKTIQRAINVSAAGDTVKVATGTFTFAGTDNPSPNVVIINKSITLSGGWNESFNTQVGSSTIDGENANNGILATNNSSIISMDRFVIQNSTSADSGGIYLLAASLTLHNSTIRNNHATNRGAGIFLISGPHLTLLNTTITGNTAGSSGGGIYMDSGTANISFSTIAFNQGIGPGAGLYRNGGNAFIENSILSDNTSSGLLNNCGGIVTSQGYNIISGMNNCTITAINGDQFNVDPLIDSTLTNSPPVHKLLAGSPAIDASSSLDCPSTDEIGTSRPVDGDSDGDLLCDIGSVELIPVGVPARISVVSGDNQQELVDHPYSHPLSVLVVDGFGDPVISAHITFIAPSTGASGTFAGSSGPTETVSTNASGIATSSTFTANGVFGSFIVTPSASVATAVENFHLRNLIPPGIPAVVSVVAGNNQKAAPNHTFSRLLIALVLDCYGDPVEGATVTFTAPSSDASGFFTGTNSKTESTITDSAGHAVSSAFTANNILGRYQVLASVAGVQGSVGFVLSNSLPTVYLPVVIRPYPVPSNFSKTTPLNNSNDQPLSLTLTWTSSSNALSYEYCLDNIGNNTCDTSWISVGMNTSVTLTGIQDFIDYHWQVRSINPSGTTYANAGVWWTFTTAPVLTKKSPLNGATNLPPAFTLDWDSTAGISTQQYCVDTINNNACDTSWVSTGADTLAFMDIMSPLTTYYWQVRIYDGLDYFYADAGNWASFSTLWSPSPGYWENANGWAALYVTADRKWVRNFKIYANLTDCTSLWISRTSGSEDVFFQFKNSFPFSYFYAADGTLGISGSFDSNNTTYVDFYINNYGPICNYYWSGSGSAILTWKNPSQLGAALDQPWLPSLEPADIYAFHLTPSPSAPMHNHNR